MVGIVFSGANFYTFVTKTNIMVKPIKGLKLTPLEKGREKHYQNLLRGYDEARDEYNSYDFGSEDGIVARKRFRDAASELGEETLNQYSGTEYDPMRFVGDFRTGPFSQDKSLARSAIIAGGFRVSPDGNDVANYFRSYADSPGFERIIRNQMEEASRIGVKYDGDAIESYKRQLRGSTGEGVFNIDMNILDSFAERPSSIGSISGRTNYPVYVGTKEPTNYELMQYGAAPYNFILGHEFSHTKPYLGGINKELFSRNTKAEKNNHDELDSEKHADIQGLKYLLFKEGIYDSRGDKDITEDEVKKMRGKYPTLRIFKQMDDRQIMDSINLVADANKKIDISNIAAYGGLIERYGSEAVREALQKMRGSHKYDGESEKTGQMNTAASQPWMRNSYLKLPEDKPSIATNFVEESAPLVQLDDDAIYLGDIEPVIFVSDRMRPAPGNRPKLDVSEAVQVPGAVDSSSPNIMLHAVPSGLSSVTRDSLDREVLVRAGIKGESIKDTSLNMLASLDDDVRKNVEAELVSQGWYDADANQILSRIKNRSDEAYRLQEHLRDLGYDLGKYGKNKDGVDGMIGRMTRVAIGKYVKEHKADALRDIASFGAFSDSQTADALARRVQYMRAHDKPSGENTAKIEDSLLGEQNIGTQYDSQFDNYQVGGFDASNFYNVPVEEYGKASSPLSFKSFPKTCSTDKCASAVTNFFLSNFGGSFIDKYNLRGDAWTMGENIVRAGGKRIFNLFDDAGAPRENNKNVTINYVRQRAKDPEYKKMLSEGLGVGDIVELLYPNSPNFKKAYEESNGHNQNTHIGMVVEKDGELYVLDNSGGTYHHAKLSDVINGKERRGVLITGAVSVNDGKDWRFGHNDESALYRADMSELGITPNEDYNKKIKGENGVGIKYHNYNNEAAYREMASLKRNSGELMSSYGLNAEEFNKLAALTHAASMMETRNGSIAEGRKFRAESGNISFGEGVGPLLQQFGRYTLPNMSESISSYIRGMEQDRQRRSGEDTTTASVLDKIPIVRKAFKPVSRGLTNVKADYHFTRDEQASLPVQGNYAEQPESSAIMGFSVLAKNYNHIKERLTGTKLGENKELLYTLTALAHNQGLNNIDTNIARYLSSGDEEELLQYMHREKEYRDALKKKDEKKAEYYNGPRYSRLMMDFTNYNKYNLVI